MVALSYQTRATTPSLSLTKEDTRALVVQAVVAAATNVYFLSLSFEMPPAVMPILPTDSNTQPLPHRLFIACSH